MSNRTNAACIAVAATTLAIGAMGACTKLETRGADRIAAVVAAGSAPAPSATPTTARERPAPVIARRHLDCVASAIWHEARGEPRDGQIAVAEVVVARMRTRGWPSTACGVVAQDGQFSFVRRGLVPSVPAEAREGMRAMARAVVAGRARSGLRGALFFHATRVSPGWPMRVVGRIGEHVFYGAAAVSGSRRSSRA